MGNALGIKTIMGLGKETSFGTPVNATDRLLLISEGINFDYSDALHDYLHGGAALPAMERLFEPVTGSLDCYVPYTVKDTTFVSASLLLALAMGNPNWDDTNKTNQIQFLDDLNVFGTIAWNKYLTTHTWEVISAMVKSFTLTCSVDKPLTMSAEILGHDLKITSTENTGTELIALATGVPKLIQLRHFVVRIGDQGGEMATADITGISSFTITVNNNLTDAEQTTTDNASSHTDPLHPIQPVRNGFREVTLEITIPRYNLDTFFDFASGDTNLQAELYATDPADATQRFDILFPNLKIQGDPQAPIAGAEAVSQTITFRALKRNSLSDLLFQDDSSYPTGEMGIEIECERTEAIF